MTSATDEEALQCSRWTFAESARQVVNGQYVDSYQIATIPFRGKDSYITTQPYGANDPDFSHDGKQIYYWAGTDSIDQVFTVPIAGGASTAIVTGCSADPNCLGDDNPAISPNGRKLLTLRAFFPIDDNGNAANVSIFKANSDGSGGVQITHPPVGWEDHDPRWSPDGNKILYVRIDLSTGIATIYSANSDGSHPHALTAPGFNAGGPDWSPDGSTIVFQSPAEPDPSTPQQIYTMRPDGSHIVQLTHFPSDPGGLTVKAFHPRWSPNGRHIVFAHTDAHTTLGADNVPHSDLFVMRRDGSHLVQATRTPDGENSPTWVPSTDD